MSSPRRRLARAAAYLLVLIGGLWTVLPLYWMLITAFKSWSELQANPHGFLPRAISTDGFAEAWTNGGSQGLEDSAVIAFGTLLVSLVLGLPAAYAFSRFRTGGSGLSSLVLSFRIMPPIAFAVGSYLLAIPLHILDTYWVLILLNSMMSIPLVVWIMKAFFDEIPREIEEAARTDGASLQQIMKDILLPLAVPGLVAVSVFVLIFTWNEFVFANLLTGRSLLPFTRAVSGLLATTAIGADGAFVSVPNYPAVAAMGVMMIVPIVLLSYYLQKHITRGMTYGALQS